MIHMISLLIATFSQSTIINIMRDVSHQRYVPEHTLGCFYIFAVTLEIYFI